MQGSWIDRMNAVICENISLLDDETFSAMERRLVQLRDRALLLVRNDSLLESDSRIEEFSALFDYQDIADDIPDESKAYLEAFCNSRRYHDKLTVCQLLAEELSSLKKSVLNRLFPSEPISSSPKIAYFRNAYADAAFRTFSEVFESPSVVYSSDFTGVCEEVYYGRADMCMLPMDSSRDAKLISFYRLIDKYELSPILSCDVISPDGGITTRYALLRRSVSLPGREQLDKSGACFFEFTLVPDQHTALCDVLDAARICGLSLYKVDSIPLSYSDSDFSCDVILRIDNSRGFEIFALFMSLAVPQYAPIGIYPHIRSRA